MGETPLTPDELRQYEQHGHVVKRSLFLPSELAPFLKRLRAIVNGGSSRRGA